MGQFDYFVVFAEMRTGSNFLETNLNSFADISCVGEAFNPYFVGYPDAPDVLGVTQAQREDDPLTLLNAVKAADGLTGFRYFHNHDPRVLDVILDDPRCAKVILTRNPVDSFVSWKIAAATGQWKLTNMSHAKTEKIAFDPVEFANHLEGLQAFQLTLMRRLQISGQTAFYVAYEDLSDLDVMNGLARFLGVHEQITALSKKLKKQNPAPMSEKVSNPEAMAQGLAQLDRFNLNRTPNFEPRRGAMIPTFVASPESPLLFAPLRSGPNQAVRRWMAQLDGRTADELIGDFSQGSLRKWKKARPGHRSFAVMRHPVSWAHTAFCRHILSTGGAGYPEIRKNLQKVHGVPLPVSEDDPTYDDGAHHSAFLAFLKFLKGNLSGQTAIRVDGAWASQTALLQGIAGFAPLDMILREQNIRFELASLAGQIGKTSMPDIVKPTDPLAERLGRIYDSDIETAARQAYMRDYINFGFENWRMPQD